MARVTAVPDWRLVGLGLIAGAIVLSLFVLVVGLNDVVAALRAARGWVLPLVVAASVGWLLLWSVSLGTVLSVLDVPHTRPVTVAAYLGIVFANNVTPFAQAGAEPLAAVIVSRATDTRFEVSLSAVASVDALNVFPSVGLAALGLLYLTVTATLNPRLELAAVLFIALVALVTAGGLSLWRHRRTAERSLRGLAGRAEARLARTGSESSRTLDLEGRVTGFVRAVERLASRPRQLGIALAYSTGGWLCLVAALWLSLYAVGHAVPAEVAMFVVPLAFVGSLTPLPGGAGGIDAAYVFLLSALTPVPLADVTAAVLVYRAATYLLPVLAGGAAATMVSARSGSAPDE
ncbi:lysylphosphatidylglycerol synthase transmembrane domain-containing protein [Haloarcula onubensis]|uniref:Flippase-like domain-containing protein n=1 Tax=Haloarcula onubensis TaxID=2950539 RepID=A0ABU2FQN0_9EURY|nr:lysylphosphatidylglycerol synthase transmembrane domain-containing protein [Halomicroarcula sp. S3CR25-11]MDS0282709.1 flippase-like domain-containing protein [Halomicroarcula sp. S3CR25-11]